MEDRFQQRRRKRRKCEGCRAWLVVGTERCGWCGAPSIARAAGEPASLSGTPMIDQEALYRADILSAEEANVLATSSQDPTVVQSPGGQPSDRPSRTTGIPSNT